MTPAPASIAILAFPETSASAVYGMYDLFMQAGRDWGVMMGGEPGASLFAPQIVTRDGAPLEIGNGVRLLPHAGFADCGAPQFVCVPEANVPPGTPLEGMFDAEVAWLRERYRAGATLATACSGAMLLAEAGLLDGEEATTHWPATRCPSEARPVRERAMLAPPAPTC